MQQTIIIGKAAKEPRQYQGRTYYGVQPEGRETWIDLYVDERPERGSQWVVDLQSTFSKKDGKQYWKAYPVGRQETQPLKVMNYIDRSGGGSGGHWGEVAPNPQPAPKPPLAANPAGQMGKFKLGFNAYVQLVEQVHALAARLEQGDDGQSAQARMALVNAAVIAATNGSLEVPSPIPEPDDFIREANDPFREGYKPGDDDVPF